MEVPNGIPVTTMNRTHVLIIGTPWDLGNGFSGWSVDVDAGTSGLRGVQDRGVLRREVAVGEAASGPGDPVELLVGEGDRVVRVGGDAGHRVAVRLVDTGDRAEQRAQLDGRLDRRGVGAGDG